MEDVVAPPGFHDKKPEAVVDSVAVPSQLLTEVTIGTAGVTFGLAATEAPGL